MTDEDAISDMLLAWEEARERGSSVAAEELCGDCPALLVALRERIRLLQSADWLREPSTAASEKPRTLAERYSLERLLGTGGSAQVWRAYDLRLHRHVALKIPNPGRTLSAPQIEEVLTEARQIASLKHVNIVAVHDVVREGGGYFLVSDLIDGETLAERLRRGPIPSLEAVKLLAQIARAVDYAHGRGVIHRDLKPANIFLDKTGQPHVGDFGLARSARELFHGSDRRGTLAYSSPEQLEGHPLDGRSDIWSLGIILFEALSGKLPFADENPVRLRQAILAARLPDSPDIGSGLMAICRRCVSSKPEDRYASGAEFAGAVGGIVSRWRLRRYGRISILMSIPLLFGAFGWSLQSRPVEDRDGPTALYLGTRHSAAKWLVSGAGASDVPAFPFGHRHEGISLTYTSARAGPFLEGATLDRFKGFWTAARKFTIPAEAETITLIFSNLECDDRGVLLLNGTVIGNHAIAGPGPGRLSLTEELLDEEYRYTNVTSGAVQSRFKRGEVNILSLIINNVVGDTTKPTSVFDSESDGTKAIVDVTVLYALPKR